MTVVIPFIYFLLLCIYFRVKHGRFDVPSFLALTYAVSAFFSIIAYNQDLNDYKYQMPVVHILPTAVYCGLLTITFIPFSRFRGEMIKEIERPKMWLFDALAYIFIATFFITIANLLPDIIDHAREGELLTLRNEIYNEDEIAEPKGIRYILALPTTLFSPCSPLMLVMYFYSVCFLEKRKIFNILLLLSSFTPVIPALLISGRTQITYWLLTFIACYLLFRPYIGKNLSKRIITIFIVLGAVVLAFFIAVTISRWKEADIIKNAVIIYAGEPYIDFCMFFDTLHTKHIHLQRLFPFTYYFILGYDTNLFAYREILYNETGIYANVFNTFLGDIMLDTGKTGMFIYTFLYATITCIALHRKDKSIMPFYQLPIYIICLLVPLEGLFFYSFHTVRMSYYIIETLIICILFRYRLKR
ncbi:MAG: oligosaccharide repeat unit polymerase [Paludibacteraceae bacterium]|nr:oligosaccharide repeat unit polymerase [Paludibacteraceae bacterium]